MVKKKKVEVFTVESELGIGLEEILLDPYFQGHVYPHEQEVNKRYELKYVEDRRQQYGYIVGLMVGTKVRNIAPLHRPGTDDFRALNELNPEENLGEVDDSSENAGDQGLAYGNVFLYYPSLNVVIYETSHFGVSIGRFSQYINELSKMSGNHTNLDFWFMSVFSESGYRRLMNHGTIELFSFKLKRPVQVEESEYNRYRSVGQAIRVAQDLHAGKGMEIKLTADKDDGLEKGTIQQYINWFVRDRNQPNPVLKKASISGKLSNDNSEESEETVNIADIFNAVLKDEIQLTESTFNENLQAVERKRQIREVFGRKFNEINRSLNFEQ
jgi:hypothetical protein